MLQVHSLQFKANSKQSCMSSRAAESHYSHQTNEAKQLSNRANDHGHVANLGNQQSFFNVVKFAIPERKNIKIKVNVVARKNQKNKNDTRQKPISKQDAKLKEQTKPITYLAHLKQNEYEDELQNAYQVEQMERQLKQEKPKKKSTLPTKLLTDDTQSHAESESKIRIQKLNLGLKKKKEKGKMNDYFKSILLRTLVEDDVVIKKSAFLSNEKLKGNKPGSLERPSNIEQIQQLKSSKKIQSHNKINLKKDKLNAQVIKEQKESSSSIKLPDIHEHKKLVELVKQQESKKNRRLAREYSKSEMKNFDKEKETDQKQSMKQKSKQRPTRNNNIHMKIEPQLKGKAIYSETIPEQIQYSSIYNQKAESKDQQQQSIGEEIVSQAK